MTKPAPARPARTYQRADAALPLATGARNFRGEISVVSAEVGAVAPMKNEAIHVGVTRNRPVTIRFPPNSATIPRPDHCLVGSRPGHRSMGEALHHQGHSCENDGTNHRVAKDGKRRSRRATRKCIRLRNVMARGKHWQLSVAELPSHVGRPLVRIEAAPSGHEHNHHFLFGHDLVAGQCPEPYVSHLHLVTSAQGVG